MLNVVLYSLENFASPVHELIYNVCTLCIHMYVELQSLHVHIHVLYMHVHMYVLPSI